MLSVSGGMMFGGYTVIDLFSGAGGLTLGFKREGFVPVLAVEKEPDFARTYAANFGEHVVAGDIVKIVNEGTIPKADVVVGGPPCQGFSNLTGNKKADPRRKLWQYYMDVVEASGCKVFVVENVPNLLKAPEGLSIIRRARELGYEIGPDSVGYVMASNYGVPQNRKRAIIIGSKIGPIPLPAANGKRQTVREALKGVPLKPTKTSLPEHDDELYSGLDIHMGRNPTPMSLKRYKIIPPGGNRFDLQRKAPELTPQCWIRKTHGGTDLFGRLNWDEPARCTIRCEFYKPEKGRFLHPSEHRPITHLEAARLQSFPDDFKWYGRKIRIAIQIGNAVPPLLAQALAAQVRHYMEVAKSKPRLKPSRAAMEQLQLISA